MGFFENMFGAPVEAPNVGMDLATVAASSKAGQMTPGYSDPAVGYANARKSAAQLGFMHVPTGATVYFMAFVTDYSDSFDTQWTDEKVYGRMDPVMTFQGTSRKISIGWDIPADGPTQGFQNLRRVQRLAKYLYPMYDDEEGATSIIKSPLWRVKFGNLIAKDMGDNVQDNGLLCACAGINFAPDIDAGFFDSSLVNFGGAELDVRGGTGGTGALAPKVIKLSCELTVLHEKLLGWNTGHKWRESNANGEEWFPYQVGMDDSLSYSEQAGSFAGSVGYSPGLFPGEVDSSAGLSDTEAAALSEAEANVLEIATSHGWTGT
tara:strand:- start:1835 stop:2794 length:960 start_codon:yes stop_codon:yes gene_type:complete